MAPDPADPWQVLASAFGALSWEHSRQTRLITGSDEIYRANIRYRGRDMRVIRSWRRSSSGNRRTFWSWSTDLEIPVASSPLRLSLSPNTITWSRVSTGDEAFEHHYRLGGRRRRS